MSEVAAIAQALGLTAVGEQMYGVRHGVPIWVEGGGRHWRASTLLSPPLDLGLLVYRRNGTAPRGTGAGVPMRLAHPGMNMEFRTFGDEPMRAAMLFSPQLCMGLLQSLANDVDINISDDGIIAYVSAPMLSGAQKVQVMLAQAIDTVGGAAATINAQRQHIPPASPLQQHLYTWQHYAAANRLQGMQTPLCMWGVMDSVAMTAYAVRRGVGHYCLEVRVSFAEPLQMGLALEWNRSSGKMRDLFGKEGIRTRDAGFDQAFTLHAADRASARQLFDGPTCGRFVAVANHSGGVWADDMGIAVQTPSFPATPDVTLGVIHQAAELAAVLDARRRAMYAAGPYR